MTAAVRARSGLHSRRTERRLMCSAEGRRCDRVCGARRRCRARVQKVLGSVKQPSPVQASSCTLAPASPHDDVGGRRTAHRQRGRAGGGHANDNRGRRALCGRFWTWSQCVKVAAEGSSARWMM